MKLVIVPQWVRIYGASPTGQKCSQQVSSDIHVHTQPWAYEAGGSEDAGRVIEPRKVSRCGKPTVCKHWKAGVLDALWHVLRTPPGSESGAWAQRGNAGTWENHWSPCAITRKGGPDDHKPWRDLGAFAQVTSPKGRPRTHGSTQGIGGRATSKEPREGPAGVVAAHSTKDGGAPRPKGPTRGKATAYSLRSYVASAFGGA